jgi:transcriptional regulator with XRE-family HTH domain
MHVKHKDATPIEAALETLPILASAEGDTVPRPPKETVLSKKEIGARLRTVRQERDVTQARLAEILGTNQSHVSNVERGDRGLTIQQLVKICRALRVSPERILGSGGAIEARPLKDRRILRRLGLIEKLPKNDRQALLKTIDAYLKSSRVA